jgi:hypothetical protein
MSTADQLEHLPVTRDLSLAYIAGHHPYAPRTPHGFGGVALTVWHIPTRPGTNRTAPSYPEGGS